MLTQTTKDYIDKAAEIEVWSCIEECGGIIWRLEHDMADERIPKDKWPELDKEIAEDLRPTQHYAMSMLPKFGIPKPLNENGNGSAEYWAWYRWWSEYMKGLDPTRWDDLALRIKNRQDISSFRPAGDWRTPEMQSSMPPRKIMWQP